MKILFVIPPGLPDMVSHHEATSGMGAFVPAAEMPGEAAFLYPPHTVAACAAVARDAGLDVGVLDGTRHGARVRLPGEVASRPCDVLALFVSHGTAPADVNFLRLLKHARGRDRVGPSTPAVRPVGAPRRRAVPCRRVGRRRTDGRAGRRFRRGRTPSQRSRMLSGVVPTAELRPELYAINGLAHRSGRAAIPGVGPRPLAAVQRRVAPQQSRLSRWVHVLCLRRCTRCPHTQPDARTHRRRAGMACREDPAAARPGARPGLRP